MSVPGGLPRPVFIVSPTTRCGSAYLQFMLNLHPFLTRPISPIYEDHFLPDSCFLDSYAKGLAARYAKFGWIQEGHYADHIVAALGRGLLSLLYNDVPPGHRVVTRTPDARGLENFDRLFPEVDLILLVRDGRAAVTSMIRTFNTGRKEAIRHWRDGVRIMLEYRANKASTVTIVRYEDVFRHEAEYVRRLLVACDLDPEIYPYGRLDELPVLGSSVDFGDSDRIHWNPIAKPRGFDPLNRFAHWSLEEREEFDELAGTEMRALGYMT